MASRIQGRSSGEDLNNDSYPESSPDPLSISYINSRPRAVRTTSNQRHKAPMAPSSTNTLRPQQQSNLDVSAVDFSSPTKSMVMHTGRTGGISPWRIKVTVEAEPEFDGSDENIGHGSPTRRRTTRTTTTTVPLRDPDASSPVKRRGRPRKSDVLSTTKPKRSGTPVRRKSKPRNSSFGVAENSNADISTENTTAPPKKRRGRPRKSLQSEADIIAPENHHNESFENASQEVQIEDTSSPDEALGFQENISKHTGFDISNPTPAKYRELPENSLQLQRLQGRTGHELHEESVLESQRKLNPAKISNNHKNTPTEKNRNFKEKSKSPSSPENEDLHTPSESDDGNNADMWRSMVANPHGNDREVAEAEDNAVNNQDESNTEDADGNYELEKGTTIFEAGQDITILESEGFSMVSIDSLPSRQAFLSSPSYQNTGINTLDQSIGQGVDRVSVNRPIQASEQDHYDLPSGLSTSFMPSSTGLTPSNIRSSPPLISPRQHTPSIIAKSPSAPPPIQAPQFSPQKASTPKLARVVKAGIALQGVLDPITEVSSGESANESFEKKIDRLDDLFSGFSEGTRRELRAGLRLGEQIAKQYQQRGTSKEASPVVPGPSKISDRRTTEDDIFNIPKKAQQGDASYPRLPTPEEKDHYVLAIPPSSSERTDVEYPSLSPYMQSAQLASPARSVDEMSWRADTPQSIRRTALEVAADTLGQIQDVAGERHADVASPRKYTDELDTQMQREQEAVSRQIEKENGSQVNIIDDDKPEENENYSDIWHEEASRSSEALPCDEAVADNDVRKSPQLQDLFTNDASLLRPAREKIPKTWRRKSSSDFNYSDEAEPKPEENISPDVSGQEHTISIEKSKGKLQESTDATEVASEDDEESEDSDDTGMFWQQNLPTVYNKPKSSELKSTKLDLSMLLGTSDIPPRSNPLSSPHKLSPFKSASPKVAPLQLSPYKNSPLKQQVMPKDLENFQRIDHSVRDSGFEQSSPGRDGAGDSVSSDIRQLRAEMEARPFEHHSLTLHEIEEVTEHSERQDTSIALPSSPPQPLETSILAPKRAYSPVFSDSRQKPASTSTIKLTERTKTVENAKPQSSGLFSYLTSTLWSAVTPAPPPPSHPIISRYDPLPRLEPWTKTHYKTLDALFQYHKRHPTAFTPGSPPNLNNTLLNAFPNRTKFLGAKYSCWGYSIIINETHLIIAAVFMQLLTLEDIAEYERVTGKTIERGSVGPGPDGKEIGAETAVRRLFTIIAGEELRKDEKMGKVVSRNGGLKIQWPN